MDTWKKVGLGVGATGAAVLFGYLLAAKPSKVDAQLTRSVSGSVDRIELVFEGEGDNLDKIVRELHLKPATSGPVAPKAPEASRYEGERRGTGYQHGSVARQPLQPLPTAASLRGQYCASIILSTPGDHCDGVLGEGKLMNTYRMEPAVKSALWTYLGLGTRTDHSMDKMILDKMAARSNVNTGGFDHVITADGYNGYVKDHPTQ